MEVAPLLQPLDEQTQWRARACGRCDAEWFATEAVGRGLAAAVAAGNGFATAAVGFGRAAATAGLAPGETGGFERGHRCGGRSSGGDGGRGASGSGDRSHAGRSSDGGCGGLGPCDGSCDGLSRHRRVIGANTPGSRRFSAAQALVMPRAFRPNLYRTIKVCIRTEKRAARRIFFLIAPVPLLASSHYAGGAFRRLHISGAVGRSDGEQDAAARARSAQPPRLFGACAAAPPGCFSFIMLHSLSRCMFYSSAPLYFSRSHEFLSFCSRVCGLVDNIILSP